MNNKQILIFWKIAMYLNCVAFFIYGGLWIITEQWSDGFIGLLFAGVTYLCAVQVAQEFYND
jgi:hypothetical protein